MAGSSIQSSLQRHHRLVHVLDICLSFFWIFPLNVVYWRGTWDILDLYIIPGDLVTGSWISLALGVTTCSLGNSLQPFLNKHCPTKTLPKVLLTRTFAYIFAFGTLNHWRGLWNLLDHYIGFGYESTVILFVIAMVMCWLLRVTATILGPPMTITYDNREDFFQSRGRLRMEVSKLK